MDVKSLQSVKSRLSNKKSTVNSTTTSYNSKQSIKGSIRRKTSNKSKSSKQSESEKSILTEEQEKQIIVSTIRQEIVEKALELIYEKYLEKQTVYFVSHCSRLAWKSLIEWNYQRKDKGGLREFAVKEQMDVEPKPSPKDAWAGNSVPIVSRDQMDQSLLKCETKPTIEASEDSTIEQLSKTDEETINSSELGVKIGLVKEKTIRHKTQNKQLRKSDEMSQTIPGKSRKSLDAKKESYELPSPVAMQAKYFPSSRVEVKYAITPGARGLVSKKVPTLKTIHLNKQRESVEQNKRNNSVRYS